MNDACDIVLVSNVYFFILLIMTQAREKFLSLRKGTKTEVAIGLEEVSCDISFLFFTELESFHL